MGAPLAQFGWRGEQRAAARADAGLEGVVVALERAAFAAGPDVAALGGWRVREDADGAGLGWLAVAAAVGVVGVAAATAVIGAHSAVVDRPWVFVTLRVVGCVGLAGVAIVVLARGSGARLAALMFALAYVYGVTGLTGANSAVPFTIGRAAVPVAVLLTLYLCLAYPTGRIEDGRASVVFAAAAIVLVLLDAVNLLLSDVPPVAGPFVRCVGDQCPRNPFNLVSLARDPSRVLSTALAFATSMSAAAVAILVGLRAMKASRLQRRSLAPIFAWGVLACLGYAFFVGVRAVDARAGLLTPAAVAVAAIIASLPFAIALGMVRGRVFAIAGLERMVAGLGEHPSLVGLQRTMARAFGDPMLRLLMWLPSVQAYVDAEGEPVDFSQVGSGRQITQFTREGERVAAAVHDDALYGDRDVLAAAGRAVRLALDNARLQSDLERSTLELEASRQRLARAADEERRRIEQDLHDGAQQDLIALRIKLGDLGELASEDPAAVASGIADAERRIDATLEHIRDLAKGIYPPVLRDFGLSRALASVARDTPLRVSVHAGLRRRYPPEVETAVYFCCVEGVQNIVKHCGAQARVNLRLSERAGSLEFVLADDGPGFDPGQNAAGRGITGMRDRIEAVGGELTITSSHGTGTRVTGRVPAAMV